MFFSWVPQVSGTNHAKSACHILQVTLLSSFFGRRKPLHQVIKTQIRKVVDVVDSEHQFFEGRAVSTSRVYHFPGPRIRDPADDPPVLHTVRAFRISLVFGPVGFGKMHKLKSSKMLGSQIGWPKNTSIKKTWIIKKNHGWSKQNGLSKKGSSKIKNQCFKVKLDYWLLTKTFETTHLVTIGTSWFLLNCSKSNIHFIIFFFWSGWFKEP